MATVNVKVVARIRPQNSIEKKRGGKPCVKVEGGNEIFLDAEEEGNYHFTFDRVFAPNSKQSEVFEYIGKPVVDSIFKGYNGTIFAYGQTSSGKTHTMSGADGAIGDDEMRGVIPRSIDYIFSKFAEAGDHIEFTVQTSFMEIYLERVKDLLDTSKTNLPIREEPGKGIYVDGVTEEYVTSPEETLSKIEEASNNRVVAATGMNQGSSRSHSVAIIKVEAKDTKSGTTKKGKLCLVDLAGSEMVRKTGAKGQQLEEAKMINKSLSALGNVITALTSGKKSHVPYRDSKLTRLLQESLGGNACTVMIICCSPSTYNAPETVSTLRFGNRAKSIKNVAKVNQQRSVQELTKLLMRAEKAIDVQSKYIGQLEKRLTAGESGQPPAKPAAQHGEPAAPAAMPPALPVPTIDAEEGGPSLSLVDDAESKKPPKRNRSGSITSVQVEMEMQIQDLNERLGKVEQDLKDEREETKSLGKVVEEKEGQLKKIAEDSLNSKRKVQEEVDLKLQELQSFLDKITSELELEREEASSLREMVDERDEKLTEMEELQARHVQQDEKVKEAEELALQNEQLRGKLSAMAQKVALAEANLVGKQQESGGEGKRDRGGSAAPPELSEDLQKLVDEGSVTMEEAQRMSGNATATSAGAKEFQALSLEDAEQVTRELTGANTQLNVTVDALRNDLRNRCEKVIQLELALDKERDARRLAEAQKSRGESPEKQQQRRALQQRLEQLVMVHRQLLRKYATMELERERARKADSLKASRITQLETNARQLAKNMLSQSERHERDMRAIVQAKDEEINQLQRSFNAAGGRPNVRASPPKTTIRGGAGGGVVAGGGQKTIRGGGTKTPNRGFRHSTSSIERTKSSGSSSSSPGWNVLNFFKGL
jgi:kinesin family member 5